MHNAAKVGMKNRLLGKASLDDGRELRKDPLEGMAVN